MSYPASYNTVVSVASVDSSEVRSSFSQYNDQVELAAPGTAVKSTITTNSGTQFSYASWSGTSMVSLLFSAHNYVDNLSSNSIFITNPS